MKLLKKKYADWTLEPNNEVEDIFRNILENGKKFENEILELENRKKEVNEIIKDMQNKISLEEMA